MSAAKRSLYLKVNKAGKVVLFVLSGQCQPTGFSNSDWQFLTGRMEITNIMWSELQKGQTKAPAQLKCSKVWPFQSFLLCLGNYDV